jgi:streptogramin lyase
MTYGSGKYTYTVVEGWGQLPPGWEWGWIPAVACDSQDRIFVYSRSEHPLVLFDRAGNLLDSWGEGLLTTAHGLYIDPEDNVYCTEYDRHCIYKFNPRGELVMTLGTPGRPGARDGDPFNRPTDVAVAPGGELFVSDGYGNSRVHKLSPGGELLLSWGEKGSGPGQFDAVHCVRLDRYGRVWVCDRENNRIQIFDQEGNFLTQRTGLMRPDSICFEPHDEVVHVTEFTHQVSLWTLDGELITKWGGGQPSTQPGEFLVYPHGNALDSRGDLYICEVQADGRLQKFERTG